MGERKMSVFTDLNIIRVGIQKEVILNNRAYMTV